MSAGAGAYIDTARRAFCPVSVLMPTTPQFGEFPHRVLGRPPNLYGRVRYGACLEYSATRMTTRAPLARTARSIAN